MVVEFGEALMLEIVREMVALGIDEEDAVRFSENYNHDLLESKIKILKDNKGKLYNPGGFLTTALKENYKRSLKKKRKEDIKKFWVVKLKRLNILPDGFKADDGDYIGYGDGGNPEWFILTKYTSMYIPYDSISCMADIIKPKYKHIVRDTDEYCIDVEKYGLMIFRDGEFIRIRRA